MLQTLADSDLQFIIVPGFWNKTINSPLINGFNNNTYIRVAGKNYTYGIWIFFLNLLEKLRALHIRHKLVRKHHINFMFFEEGESLFPAFSDQDVILFIPNQTF